LRLNIGTWNTTGNPPAVSLLQKTNMARSTKIENEGKIALFRIAGFPSAKVMITHAMDKKWYQVRFLDNHKLFGMGTSIRAKASEIEYIY
jgi:hypothetical protein